MGFVVEVVLGALFVILCALAPTSTALGFKCSTSGATCQGLVGYKSPNTTAIAAIQALFNVTNLVSILGANNLPLSTPPTYKVTQNQTIRVPFPCSCSNGTGISMNTPQYTIMAGDGLYHIAAEVFSNVVTYPDIQKVNNITDKDIILAGNKLWIPLPCSCDKVAGQSVIHYGHVVEPGSSVDAIAKEFDVSVEELMTLNGLANVTALLADTPIDVPLKVCSSAISNESLDSSLIVANGSYAITANGCVQCNCASADNWILQCKSSSVCPSVKCENSTLYLGNTTTDGPCNATACAYAGYTKQGILTALVTESTCPAPSPAPTLGAPVPSPAPTLGATAPPLGATAPPPGGGNSSTTIGLRGFSWNIVATVILAIFSLHHRQ